MQKYEKSLGLGLEIKSLALVLVLKIMELLVLVLVLTTKSYLHHCLNQIVLCRGIVCRMSMWTSWICV